MVLIYNSFILVFQTALRIAAIWNTKAKNWVNGRKNLWKQLQEISKKKSIIWIHASSAGEFEQAKPLIESLKKTYPSYKILISFFSPSGYQVSLNYKPADLKFYLPIDTPANAKRFVEMIKPELVVFIKYDFWYHYLKTVYTKKIPLLLVSAVFRKEQAFFKWYGGFYKTMLFFFSRIFVQDRPSLAILQENRINNSQLSGDTRFDRVSAIASAFTKIPFIEEFISGAEVIIAGSTWSGDEELLKQALSSGIKLIVAPHEADEHNINRVQGEFYNAVLYSQIGNESNVNAQVLIIDNVGMLSKLYHYATIAYVGGGFTKDGVHNVLEAAVHAKPVLFGPNYKKYREAEELIEAGSGFSIKNTDDLKNTVAQLLENKPLYRQTCEKAIGYINSKTGATENIMNYIQENRLLTN